MKLVSVGVNGYGRFAQRTEMRVDGRVVALVGPNEAGKTSLLKALVHLNTSREFAPGELTRGQEPPDETVWARFAVEADDREEFQNLKGASEVRWFVVSADAGGAVEQRIEPAGAIRRDRASREKVADKLERAGVHKSLAELLVDGEEPKPWRDAAFELSKYLAEAGETLDKATLNLIRQVAGVLAEVGDRPPCRRLGARRRRGDVRRRRCRSI